MGEERTMTSKQLQYAVFPPKTPGAWRIFLDESLCIKAQEAALLVAERMRDRDFINTTVEQARQQAVFPKVWSATSVSGFVGLALMYGYLERCFPGQGWDLVAQQYLCSAAAGSQQSTILFPGLFDGTSSLALTLSLSSRGGKRYQKTLARLHQGLCEQVLQHQWRRPESDGGVAFIDYDIISGAAGILAYLVSIEQPDALVQSAVEHLLEYLVWLAKPGQPMGQERWYIPPALLPNEGHREAFPQGNFNCGLAHGIPGPLAALALSWLAGYRYPGLRESISYLADWLVQHQVHAPWGIDWPLAVPFEAAFSPDTWKSLSAAHAAWCYGAPGISRSFWLAGQALEDERLCQVAIKAIEGTLYRPISLRGIPAPNICHGVSGLLQICLHFAQESESSLAKDHIPLLVEQILDAFNPAFALGFRDIEQGVFVDQPAWLTGAPGIAMTLLAASTPVIPVWDRILGIA